MMRIVPPGSIAVRKWWLALVMLWLVAANVGLAGWVYRARQNAIQAQGCREVLQLLEHPAVFREAIPAPKFIKGTRIYQDFEK
jgi:hypothetical protein